MQDVAHWQFTVEDFERMGAAGILAEDDRVELVSGEIIKMSPIGSRHAACVKAFNRGFAPLFLRNAAVVGIQDPVKLSAETEVYPDVSLLRPRPDDYGTAHPTGDDVLLIVEVSDTTLAYDRGVKLPLYARAGVPEVWVVDLGGEQVLVYREPRADTYLITQSVRRGASLSPQAFPDLRIAAQDVLL